MKRLPVLLIAGLLGYLTFFILFPRVNPAAKWKVTLNRSEAIAKARQFAAENSVALSKLTALVRADYFRRNEYYLAREADPFAPRLLQPVLFNVRFKSAGSDRSYRVTLNPSAEVIGFRSIDRQSRGSDDDPDDNQTRPSQNKSNDAGSSALDSSKMPESSVPPADRTAAEELLKKLFGTQWNRFTLSDSSSSPQGTRLAWSGSGRQVKVTAETTVQNGKVVGLSVDPVFTPQFQTEYEARRTWQSRLLANADNLIIWPTIFLAIIFYFIGLALKRIQHRPALTFLAATFLLFLINSFLGTFADALFGDFNLNPAPRSRLAVTVIVWLVFLLVIALVAAFLYFCWAAGQSIAIRLPHRPTAGLELILKGKVFTQPVVKSLLIGLASGGILCAIPSLIAASGLFPIIELDPSGLDDLMVSRSPALSSFLNSSQMAIFGGFALLIPFALIYVKPPRLARVARFGLAFFCLLGFSKIYLPVSALLLVCGLVACLLTFVYLRAGLVAVMVACFASQTALSSAALLAQPSTALRNSGWFALAGLGTLTIAALGSLKFAREVKDEELALPPGLLVTRAERDRLKAEFDVARRAQEQMLPDATPQIEGFEIAAVCRPSREVGGDLYDFIDLPGGRLGVVVADVSGKGVPASLYMTLTKGLLDSVAEKTDDPGEILREVNRHLYEVCHKKVFVTLFLGVLDPIRKNMVYARAGHNPPVFYRSSPPETKLLKPPGMGLGLGGSKIFDDKLKVEMLELQPNDTLFFYSDGITEAMNVRNEEYGEERLMNLAAGLNGVNADQALRTTMADVEKFLGAMQPQDDQTLVVVRVL